MLLRSCRPRQKWRKYYQDEMDVNEEKSHDILHQQEGLQEAGRAAGGEPGHGKFGESVLRPAADQKKVATRVD